MNQNSYVLALDVGERRIGVALASLIARLPAPLLYIDREKKTDIVTEINSLIVQYGVSVIVVGFPRNLRHEETKQTAYVKSFVKELGAFIDIPIILQDEAGTSVEAEAILKSRKKPYAKGDIDAEAAALILRDYLISHIEATA